MRSFVFIYARSDSHRLPGKALLPLSGRALIDIVCDRARRVPVDGWALLTSDRPVDDSLALHAEARGLRVIRGDAYDLITRTLQAITETGATCFLRLNGDSPLFEPTLAEWALKRMDEGKLLSNLFKRCFPYGVAVEWVDAGLYRELARHARAEELEHVTQHLYRLASDIPALSIEQERDDSELHLALDTIEDHARLETLAKKGDITAAPYWTLLAMEPPALKARLLEFAK